jgi:uncharacterized RDD family membrane protein YckC
MSEQISTNTTSFGPRAMAIAIDFALLAALHCFLFLWSTGWFIKEVINLESLAILTVYSSYLAVLFVSFVFLHMAYFTVFHAWTGQTIGKMIMGIKVVTVGNRLMPLSVAFLRWSGYILSSLPLATGFLWSAVDKDHCAWHDKLAGTRVVTLEMT